MEVIAQKSALENRRRHIAANGYDVIGSSHFLQDREAVRLANFHLSHCIEFEEERPTDVAIRSIGYCRVLRRDGVKFARRYYGSIIFFIAVTGKEKRRGAVELKKER